jgi:cyclic pyranopterin monophosphate synthase
MSQPKPKVLTHYDTAGRSRMVDVSAKPATLRKAVAEARVRMQAKTLRAIRQNPKGDPLEIARIAGIGAAKKTAELIPLCHTLLLTHVDVDASVVHGGIHIISEVRSTGPTGVEMEALTAAAVAGLTIYDMCKAMDRGIEIGGLRLVEKSGGKSGRYIRKQKAVRKGQ